MFQHTRRLECAQCAPCKEENKKPQPQRKAMARDGVVLVKLRHFRLLAGLTQEGLADCGVNDGLSSMSRTTIFQAESGEKVSAASAQLLADKLTSKHGERITIAHLTGEEINGHKSVASHWRCAGKPSPFTLAPNGLQWRTQKLEHTLIPNRIGRGKYYDLSHMSSTHQREFQAYLVARHPHVCDLVGFHRNIARNYDAYTDQPNSNTWWIVDQWLEGSTLADVLEHERLTQSRLKLVMGDIACGLEKLHSVGVIRRNLTPASIILTDNGGVLTDFELARLPGAPTVSANAKWREDAYLAPEVLGPAELTPACDLYSWARIFAHAACGELPRDNGHCTEMLTKATVPKRVRDVVLECLLSVRKRPQKIDSVLSAINKWK